MNAILPNLTKQSATRSYAAIAIERFLAIREDNNQYRFQREHIASVVVPLFTNLFAALEVNTITENPYVMKAIAQVMTIIKEGVIDVVVPTIQALSQKLTMIYAAPVNADFGHSLFESLAAVISFTCKSDKSNINQFEQALFPIFSKIVLEPGAGTFSPYVFQVCFHYIAFYFLFDFADYLDHVSIH